MSPDVHVGPVTTPPQIAQSEGRECVLGGGPYTGSDARGGQFVSPTIFTSVHNKMRIAQEEVFGSAPVAIPFEDEAEAVAIANDTALGLAAGIWTSVVRTACQNGYAPERSR